MEAGGITELQGEAFGCGRGEEEVDGALEQVLQVEGFRYDFQLAGFHFGEVEDVVQDGEETLGRVFDNFQIRAAGLGNWPGKEKLGHADDAV